MANRFGFTDTEFSYIKARHVSSAKRNPYDVLGITPEIGNDALKIHYRKLVAHDSNGPLIGLTTLSGHARSTGAGADKAALLRAALATDLART